jgi:hypothetical protein
MQGPQRDVATCFTEPDSCPGTASREESTRPDQGLRSAVARSRFAEPTRFAALSMPGLLAIPPAGNWLAASAAGPTAASDLPWPIVLSSVAAAISASAAVYGVGSARKSRRVTDRISALDVAQKDSMEQGHRVIETERHLKAALAHVRAIHNDVGELAQLRADAMVDASRTLLLPRTAFSLQRHSFQPYQQRLRELRDHLEALRAGLVACGTALRPVNQPVWGVPPSEVAAFLIELEEMCRRLVDDPGLNLHDADSVSRLALEKALLLSDRLEAGRNDRPRGPERAKNEPQE